MKFMVDPEMLKIIFFIISAKFGTFDKINFVSITLRMNFLGSVFQTINKIKPDEIYNLAGQSSGKPYRLSNLLKPWKA